MAQQTRRFSFRLKAEGGQQVRQELNKTGDTGQKVMTRGRERYSVVFESYVELDDG